MRKVLHLMESWFYFILILVVAGRGLLAIPLVMFWKRGFDTAYSVMITLIVLSMDIALLWVLGSSLLYGKWENLKFVATRRRTAGSESSAFSNIIV